MLDYYSPLMKEIKRRVNQSINHSINQSQHQLLGDAAKALELMIDTIFLFSNIRSVLVLQWEQVDSATRWSISSLDFIMLIWNLIWSKRRAIVVPDLFVLGFTTQMTCCLLTIMVSGNLRWRTLQTLWSLPILT